MFMFTMPPTTQPHALLAALSLACEHVSSSDYPPAAARCRATSAGPTPAASPRDSASQSSPKACDSSSSVTRGVRADPRPLRWRALPVPLPGERAPSSAPDADARSSRGAATGVATLDAATPCSL